MSAPQVVVLDAEELVSPETFALIQQHYWVSAYRNGEQPYWWDWVFSLTQPRQVPNLRMEWRRPTYQEACTREWWFRNERKHWDHCIGEYGGRLRRYCGPRPLPVTGGSAPEPIKPPTDNDQSSKGAPSP